METEFDHDPVAMILGLKDIRKAARNYETFSSNAPFRVPIPREESLRSVRQFPIESDPPEHTEYRKIVEPIFNRPNQTDYQRRITEIIEALVTTCMEADSFDAVNDLPFPYNLEPSPFYSMSRKKNLNFGSNGVSMSFVKETGQTRGGKWKITVKPLSLNPRNGEMIIYFPSLIMLVFRGDF